MQAPYHQQTMQDHQQQHQQQQQQQPEQQYAAEVVQQVAGPRTHACISCQVPIAVHGRLVPCKHAFCLECATEMPKCVICCANIHVVERVPQPLYISPLSHRTFFSEEELQTDTRQAFKRLMSVPALAEAYVGFQQQRQAQQGVGGVQQAQQQAH